MRVIAAVLLLVLCLLAVKSEQIDATAPPDQPATEQKRQPPGFFTEIMEYFVFLLGLAVAGAALVVYALSFRGDAIVDFTVYSQHDRDSKSIPAGSMHSQSQNQQMMVSSVLHELGDSVQAGCEVGQYPQRMQSDKDVQHSID